MYFVLGQKKYFAMIGNVILDGAILFTYIVT